MRALVAGWFSFSDGTATGGDLLAAEVVCSWLSKADIPYEIAAAPPFVGGVAYIDVNPVAFTHVIFVCGPFSGDPLERGFLQRFAGCRLIGINLSMAHAREVWNPFDLLIERDTPATANPDLVFASKRPLVPVVGLCLVEPYAFANTVSAESALRRLVAARELAIIDIDTRLDLNRVGMRTAAEIESAIARVDVILTTRLHGMVMALKHGVPAIAIDPEPGGAKILRQARTIGWPFAWAVDALDEAELNRAFDNCLKPAARSDAWRAAGRASERVDRIGEELVRALTVGRELESTFAARLASRTGSRVPFWSGQRPQRRLVPEGLRRVLRPVKWMLKGAIAGASGPPLLRRSPPIPPVTVRKVDASGQPIPSHRITG